MRLFSFIMNFREKSSRTVSHLWKMSSQPRIWSVERKYLDVLYRAFLWPILATKLGQFENERSTPNVTRPGSTHEAKNGQKCHNSISTTSQQRNAITIPLIGDCKYSKAKPDHVSLCELSEKIIQINPPTLCWHKVFFWKNHFVGPYLGSGPNTDVNPEFWDRDYKFWFRDFGSNFEIDILNLWIWDLNLFWI